MRHTNRRRDPRVELQCHHIPNYRLHDPARSVPGVLGRVLNLSRGGAAIHIENLPLYRLALDQQLVVTGLLPRTGRRLRRVACIVSQRRDQVRGKIFGLRWVAPEDADCYTRIQEERLEKALQELMRKGLRNRSRSEDDFVALLAKKAGQSVLRWPTPEAVNLAGCMTGEQSVEPGMSLELPDDDGFVSIDSCPAPAGALQLPRESDSILVRVRGWWSAVSPGWWKDRSIAQVESTPAAAPFEGTPTDSDSEPTPSARLPRTDARELLFGSVEAAPPYAPRQLDAADEALMRKPLESRAVANRPSGKFDPDRIYKSWLESARTALTSTNAQMSQSRFDFAIECYHKLRDSGATTELLRSVEVATRYLIALYPTESRRCVAQGMLDEAAASHSARSRAELLQQAEAIIHLGMNSSRCHAARLRDLLGQIRDAAVLALV